MSFLDSLDKLTPPNSRSQFNPTSLSPSAALSILFLTIAHAPFSPDFGLAWSLLSDSFVNGAALPPVQSHDSDEDSDDDEPAKKVPATPKGEKETAQLLQSLSSTLQGRKFRQFWSAVNKVEGGADVKGQMEELKRSSKGWEKAIREEIAKEVELSFRSVKKEILAGFMGTEGEHHSVSISSIGSTLMMNLESRLERDCLVKKLDYQRVGRSITSKRQ